MLLAEVAAGGMSEIITQLTTGLTPAVFFGQVKEIMPFVVTMVPISLGLLILRRMVKGAGKAKVRF